MKHRKCKQENFNFSTIRKQKRIAEANSITKNNKEEMQTKQPENQGNGERRTHLKIKSDEEKRK
jgi:hypothetical protein